MPETLKPIAKAVAAFLAPLVVAAVVKGLDWIGVDVAVDATWVESMLLGLITSAVTAASVWATRNKPPT